MVTRLHDICFPSEHQEVLIDLFQKYDTEITSLAQNCYGFEPSKITPNWIAQFLQMSIFQFMFDLTRGKAFHILTHPQAHLLHKFLSLKTGSFPSISVASARMDQFQWLWTPEILQVAEKIQEDFYQIVGEMYRNRYQVLYHSEKGHFNPSIEIFFGCFSPKDLWPTMDVMTRGRMMPFLHLYLYQQANHETNLVALIGKCKEISVQDRQIHFPFATQAGFIGGPPERTKFYNAVHWLEDHFSMLDHEVTQLLIRLGIMDISMSTFDCTNIPVDDRDRTGSIGTGSRGTFSGHKEGVATAANCLPIVGNLETGRVSDALMFDSVFQETMNVAASTLQDVHVWALDAAFNNPRIINVIEQEQAIPLIDLNPKNSKLLQIYKQAVNAVAFYSKKALEGLSLAERKSWFVHLKEKSQEHGGVLSLQQKKQYLRTDLENLANYARQKGLSRVERREEKKLRRKLRLVRSQIRSQGTIAEQKMALQTLLHGTIEWYLVYGIRGQNEGIHGITKKRNFIIGDGQHTTWVIGHSKIEGRVTGIITAIKCVAWIRYVITGDRHHMLCILYNWRRQTVSFWVIFVVRFCRKTP
jgi:hypothetical protein